MGPLRRLFRLVRLAVGIAFVLGAATLAGGFLVFVETLERTEQAPHHHAEGVVALTGGADRVTDALSLLARGEADRLLISGVNASTSGDEIVRLAPQARTFLECCIDLGYAAENTVGNAVETSRWARVHNIRSLIVVTSNYHMPRALAEIGHAAPGVELVAYPVVTERARTGDWWANGQRLRLVLAEYLKYVVTLARLRLLSDPVTADGSNPGGG